MTVHAFDCLTADDLRELQASLLDERTYNPEWEWSVQAEMLEGVQDEIHARNNRGLAAFVYGGLE
jgi:hypothetical protein